MGMLLSLLHKFGLDFLSPGDLVEGISSVNRGRVRNDLGTVPPSSDEDIPCSLRLEPYTDSEHPPARSTAGMIMNVIAKNIVLSIHFGELLPIREAP